MPPSSLAVGGPSMYGTLAELSGGSVRVELEDVLSDGGSRVSAESVLAMR